MVGYTPASDVELPRYAYGVAGAGSGVITRCIAQPLDVLKIRFQLQVEPVEKGSDSKYHSMLQACRSIYREEKLPAFWKGHVPAQFLSVIYGVVQFTSFELLTRYAWEYLPKYFTTDLQPVTHFTCGSLAGCSAMIVAQPFDVLRTRFVAQGHPKVYRSLLHASQRMVKLEGFSAFYKGLTPAILQIAPQTGLQFGFYSLFVKTWMFVFSAGDKQKFDSVRSLFCGSAAGFCAKLSTYPLDVMKKRLQVQGFAEGRKNFGHTKQYRGFYDCAQTIARREGLRGLYKGLSPSLVKALVSVGLHFWTYEWCCHLLRTVYKKQT